MTEKSEAKTKAVNETPTVDLYNANDGIHGRDGGPYLDQVEAINHERLSAAREGSKPDLDNPRPYPGILLRTTAQQVTNFNPMLTAGDDRRQSDEINAVPLVTEVPVVSSVLSDFSLTDTEDKGDVKDEDPLPPLNDNPAENNVTAAVEKN